MSHAPAAQWRAARLSSISITLDTLRADTPFLLYQAGPVWLIVVRDGVECGELELAYWHTLAGPVRPLLYHAMRVPDPRRNLVGYRRCMWWHRDWVIGPEDIAALEAARSTRPWPHHWIT